MNFMEFSRFYFNFLGIFLDLIHLKNGKKGLFNHAGPAKLMWHGTDKWRGHTSPRGCLCGAYMA